MTEGWELLVTAKQVGSHVENAWTEENVTVYQMECNTICWKGLTRKTGEVHTCKLDKMRKGRILCGVFMAVASQIPDLS